MTADFNMIDWIRQQAGWSSVEAGDPRLDPDQERLVAERFRRAVAQAAIDDEEPPEWEEFLAQAQAPPGPPRGSADGGPRGSVAPPKVDMSDLIRKAADGHGS